MAIDNDTRRKLSDHWKGISKEWLDISAAAKPVQRLIDRRHPFIEPHFDADTWTNDLYRIEGEAMMILRHAQKVIDHINAAREATSHGPEDERTPR